jgi:hypothetical protein
MTSLISGQRSASDFVPNTAAWKLSFPSDGDNDDRYYSLYLDPPHLDDLQVRLKTFLLWPSWAPKAVTPHSLAAAGLYYTGDGDTTRCFCCRRTFAGWTPFDVPANVHRRASPNCRFVILLSSTPAKMSRRGGGTYQTDGEVLLPADDLETDCVGCSSSSGDDLSHQRTDLDRPNTAAAAAGAPRAQTDSTSGAGRRTRTNKRALKAENERLRDAITCHACHSEKVQTLFLPCRHLVTCAQCAEQMDNCIRCQQRILGTVRTFLL